MASLGVMFQFGYVVSVCVQKKVSWTLNRADTDIQDCEIDDTSYFSHSWQAYDFLFSFTKLKCQALKGRAKSDYKWAVMYRLYHKHMIHQTNFLKKEKIQKFNLKCWDRRTNTINLTDCRSPLAESDCTVGRHTEHLHLTGRVLQSLLGPPVPGISEGRAMVSFHEFRIALLLNFKYLNNDWRSFLYFGGLH